MTVMYGMRLMKFLWPYLPLILPKDATHLSWTAKFSSLSTAMLKIMSGGRSSPAPVTARPPVMWSLLRV